MFFCEWIIKVLSLHIAYEPPRLRIYDTCGAIKIVELKVPNKNYSANLAEPSLSEIISAIRM